MSASTRDPHDPVARDPLVERLAGLARDEAARTSAYPGLDGALQHARTLRRVRSGAAAATVIALLAALVLPFTPIRIGPLDDLAATIGLIDRADGEGRSLRQDVAPDAVPYREATRAVRPVPGGTPIADAAWRRAAATRALRLLGMPDRATPGTRVVWAVDDGTWVRAAVVRDVGGPADQVLTITLTGPSGAPAADLELSAVIGGAQAVGGFRTPLDVTGPGTVAVLAKGARAVAVSPLPDVDRSGTVSFTWTPLTAAENGLWVADLAEPSRGRLTRVTWADGERRLLPPPACACELPGADDDDAATSVEGLLGRSWLRRYAGLGYAGASADLHFDFLGDVVTDIDLRVRIAGVRTPGGGWLVSGDLTSEDGQGAPFFYQPGDRRPLEIVASAAPKDGGTPFVGLAPSLTAESTGYVLLWVPAGITRVRSGAISAPVENGVALLDLRQGGRRVAPITPQQAVLVEGLDASGAVVARTRVNEPDRSNAPDQVDLGPEADLEALVRATNRWTD